MEKAKQFCRRCGEIFEILKAPGTRGLTCPRCYGGDLEDYAACSLEAGPPPWEFECQKCLTRFSVTAPRGPDEAKAIRCPVCGTANARWLALAVTACASGG
jgi:DNA-directed RNA polymerase subunit RPC12/RpoP